MRRRAIRCGAGLLTAMVGLLPGCFSLEYNRMNVGEPVADATLQALRPGRDSLADCLSALGAPELVYEHRTTGVALLWFWKETAGWGFEVSSPSDDVPASLTLELEGSELPGCMLWFGPDLVLERWRQGTIGDLLRDRVRPTLVDG
jgi:hypothetical protein